MYSLAFSSQQVNGQIKAGELENGIRATTWYVCAQQDNGSQLRLLSFFTVICISIQVNLR